MGTSGQILLTEQISPTRSELVVLTKGAKQPIRHVTDGNHLRGRLVDGGVIFASGDDARVMVSLHEEPPRELAKVEGGVIGLQPLDAGRFAALGARGELVRGSLTGNVLERVHVDLEPDGFLGTDRVRGTCSSSMFRHPPPANGTPRRPRGRPARQADPRAPTL